MKAVSLLDSSLLISDDMKEMLLQNRLFQGLSDEDVSYLFQNISEELFEKDELVFAVGTPSENLYFVITGQVKLFNIRKGSAKEEIVCLNAPGSYFCLAPLLSREAMHINARTISDTFVIVIPKAVLDVLIDRSHVFSKNVIRALAGKECDLCEQVCDLSLSTTKERLAKYLLDQSTTMGKMSFKLPVRQNELASHLGTVRETLSRDFSALRKARVIELKANTIKILLPDELRNIAAPNGAFNILD